MTPMRRIVAEHQAFIWVLALALVANVLVFVFVVYPLSERVAGGEAVAAESAAALRAARSTHAEARATVEGKGQADAELQRFYDDVLPAGLSAARGMTYLMTNQLASRLGLQQRGRQFTETAVRDSSLGKLTMTLSLSGEYAQIRRFIHDLEMAPDFLVLEHVELSQVEGQARGIDVTVQIATYYRTRVHGD
jgi:type IV pilus assembly protein PilO